ncbi:acyltransferase family protein [Plantactinospora sp. GCM10030261]|uniref:acyltransferase family protein n=1 Tax=Plantactinospora sp. GCM10030261 TaxID=3273420 RepID=UPI00361A579D
MSALDGLRGVAAFVVLLHHTLLIRPELAAGYVADPRPAGGWVDWLLTYTPLHLAWAGAEAVVLFFVLSGYVLALPAARGRPTRWRRYYPRRLLRLYPPVWGAVLLALVWALLVPRGDRPGASWWLNLHAPMSDTGRVLHDLVLLRRPGFTNTALWSLKWEVLFSLLLPAYLVVGRWLRRWPLAVGATGLAALVFLGASFGGFAGRYLPIFVCGVFLAFNEDRLRRLFDGLDAVRRPVLCWWTVVAGCVVALTAHWLLLAVLPAPGTALVLAAWTVQVAGATLAVLLVIRWPAAGAALDRPVPRWLGSRSFSLYLVHEPIVVSTALVLGGTPPVPVALAVAVPVSLVVAEVFHRAVERPSLRLSHAVGGRAAAPSGGEALSPSPGGRAASPSSGGAASPSPDGRAALPAPGGGPIDDQS